MEGNVDNNVEQIENGQATAIGSSPKEHTKQKDTDVAQNKAEVWKYFERRTKALPFVQFVMSS